MSATPRTSRLGAVLASLCAQSTASTSTLDSRSFRTIVLAVSERTAKEGMLCIYFNCLEQEKFVSSESFERRVTAILSGSGRLSATLVSEIAVLCIASLTWLHRYSPVPVKNPITIAPITKEIGPHMRLRFSVTFSIVKIVLRVPRLTIVDRCQPEVDKPLAPSLSNTVVPPAFRFRDRRIPRDDIPNNRVVTSAWKLDPDGRL